jgi:CBS domain-containing protein
MPNARDVLSKKSITGIISTTPEQSVQEASKLMLQRSVGCLVVTGAEGKIVGLLTEHDVLCRLVAEDRDASDTKVSEIMSRDVAIVEPERSLEEIEAIMRQQHLHYLPVAGEKELLGLLSMGDVLAYHAAEDKQMVHYLREYMYGRW